nr:PREDICTED: LOW QUALITY PROTEIN: apolipoprotein L6 [Equus przewalskii]
MECQAGVGLQGDEDDLLLSEDMEQKDADLSADERRFLEEFPILKEKLGEDIRKFRARADDIEKKQKILTEASLVTNSISAVSGAVSLLGLALTPATGGGSLVLLGCVETLGSIAGATNIVTNLAKEVQNAQAEAGSPEPTDGQRSEETEGKGRLYYGYLNNIKDVKEKIRASKTASAHPLQAAGAEGIKTTSQVTVESGRKLPKVFERIKLLMARHPRLLNGTVTGISLCTCMAALLKDWKELKEGAKSKSAEKLKAKAGELEKKLLDLSQRYERLQQKKLLQEKRLLSSSSEGAVGTLPQPSGRASGSWIQKRGEDDATEPRDLGAE